MLARSEDRALHIFASSDLRVEPPVRSVGRFPGGIHDVAINNKEVRQREGRECRCNTKRGTKTTFKPDPQIFPNTKFIYATLQKRMQELAFLNQGVRITIADDRTGEKESYQYDDGLRQYVQHLNRANKNKYVYRFLNKPLTEEVLSAIHC